MIPSKLQTATSRIQLSHQHSLKLGSMCWKVSSISSNPIDSTHSSAQSRITSACQSCHHSLQTFTITSMDKTHSMGALSEDTACAHSIGCCTHLAPPTHGVGHHKFIKERGLDDLPVYPLPLDVQPAVPPVRALCKIYSQLRIQML